MRVFVGFGYNERDAWIEDQVFPLLRCMGFTVAHGKDMHGRVVQPEVEQRIRKSDAVIGFFTIREGQGDADFTSHIWVKDELSYAVALKKPIIPIREEGVKVPNGILGDRQYIPLVQTDRLACIVELVDALGRRNIRKLKLDPEGDQLNRNLWTWQRQQGFVIRYRTRDAEGDESQFNDGRLEVVDQGFYLNVADVPSRAYVDVQGVLGGVEQFNSGWVSADAVQVKIY